MKEIRKFEKNVGLNQEFWILLGISVMILLLPALFWNRPIISGLDTTWGYFLRIAYPLYAALSLLNWKLRPIYLKPQERCVIVFLWKYICEIDKGFFGNYLPMPFGFFWLEKRPATMQPRYIPPMEKTFHGSELTRIPDEMFKPIEILHIKSVGDQRKPLNQQIIAEYKMFYNFQLIKGLFIPHLKLVKELWELDYYLRGKLQSVLKQEQEKKTFAESAGSIEETNKILLEKAKVVLYEPLDDLMQRYSFEVEDSYGAQMLDIGIYDINPGKQVDLALKEFIERLYKANATLVEGATDAKVLFKKLREKGKGLKEIMRDLGIPEGDGVFYTQMFHETYKDSNLTTYHLPFVEKFLGGILGKGFTG